MNTTLTLTVSQLNDYVKSLLDSSPHLNDLCIRGEISNFKNHYASGHLYFTVKDSTAQLKAVMFRSNAVRLRFVPEDGMRVIVHGYVSVYTRDGVYQLYADDIQPDGVGALYTAYEQMKARLLEEGLFDEDHKKPIPRYPKAIGIITAENGAAVADMKNILTRRYPLCAIRIYPALVQGAGAAETLCAGIRYFNRKENVDTIIIGRGGGSIEDLWAFNDEVLARTIYASDIPVISAVGHETDYTICDFVSDLRAPTPSGAAELAVPDRGELLLALEGKKQLLTSCIRSLYADREASLAALRRDRHFLDPHSFAEERRQALYERKEKLQDAADALLRSKRSILQEKIIALDALNPLSILRRGYAAVTREDGTVISDAASLHEQDMLRIQFHDGKVLAEVKTIKGGTTHADLKEKR